MVYKASKIHEWVFPTISAETIGSSVYSIIPFSALLAACFIAALTSSTVTSFLRIATKSVIDPSGVGSLNEKPSSLPFSSFIIFPIVFAAPVVVGIIETAADRALLKSLCGRSRIH